MYDLVPEYEHGLTPFVQSKIDEILAFLRSLTHPFSEEYWPAYKEFIKKLEVDNFGKWAGRQILDELGLWECPREFQKEADRLMEDLIKVEIKEGSTSDCKRIDLRISCFARYSFLLPSGKQVEGDMQQISGTIFDRGDDYASSCPLKAVPLPLSHWVDRRLCAEARLLAKLCELLGADPGNVSGTLNIHAGYPPCTSCLGLLWQFDLRCPHISLSVSIAQCL